MKQQDFVIEKNYSEMDTEELNEHFEQLGEILGSDATDSAQGDIYASSYVESLSSYKTELESHRLGNGRLA